MLNDLKLFAKDLNILIVEDDKDLNSSLVGLTSLFFYEVDSAFDGVEALEKYKSKHYDIVFSDILMSKMNGIALAKEIKAINEEQIIMIFSAFTEIDKLMDLINLGIHQFVSKPFNEEQFCFKLLKICENITYRKNYMNKNNLLNVETFEKKSFDFNNFTNAFKHEIINSKDFFEKFSYKFQNINNLEEYVNSLLQLDKNFENEIRSLYLNRPNNKIISNISKILNEISQKLEMIEIFVPFSKILKSFSKFLTNLDISTLTKKEIQKLTILEFVYDDLSRFIQIVFVYKNSIDVNYLQDSLKSSILQIEKSILVEKIEEEDLELFN